LPARRPAHRRLVEEREGGKGKIPWKRRRSNKRERERCQGVDRAEGEKKNRGGREKELPKDLCANSENYRDLFVNYKFLINLKL
jgi:hypothetical protein